MDYPWRTRTDSTLPSATAARGSGTAPAPGRSTGSGYRRAQFLGLPDRIIKQRPSPGLGGIRDEEILGPYPLVDMILMAIHQGHSEAEINHAITQYLPKRGKESRTKKIFTDKGHVRFVRRLAELSAQKRKSNVITE